MSGSPITVPVSTHCQRTSPFSCTCTNLKATYVHPGTNHQWTIQPAISDNPPGADGTPHPSPCPNDGVMCNVIYTKCPMCGDVHYWNQSAV